ncbi:uncharacterized protein L201_000594 [Kwoniella dendrophila CBS 6074]|uniref:N-acetyltransferase domain-containing protein n=1 Tax=Kwoniella dendrophila CBS 6074 TaxID=1295534 RepID=A0AAX4JLE4_9TREE
MTNQSIPNIEPTHADVLPINNLNNPEKPIDEIPDYVIKLAKPEDAKAISKLVGSTWTKHFGYSVSPEDLDKYVNITLSPESFEKEIKEDSKYILILAFSSTPSSNENKEELLGVSQLVINSYPDSVNLKDEDSKRGYIELQRLYTSDKTHGKGLGQLLVKSSEEKSNELGKTHLWLGVWVNNHRGKKFYEKVGFKQIGEKTFYAGQSKRPNLVLSKEV